MEEAQSSVNSTAFSGAIAPKHVREAEKEAWHTQGTFSGISVAVNMAMTNVMKTKKHTLEVYVEKGHVADVVQMAIRNNRLTLVYKYVTKQAANGNMRTSSGTPILYHAVMKGDKDLTDHILQCGADINAQCGPCGTCLHIVAGVGDLEWVEFLVERGADINTTDAYDISVLDAALEGEHMEVAQFLARKLDRTTPSEQALLVAAAEGKVEEVQRLITQEGASVNTTSGLGASVLQWATESGHIGVMKELIRLGADVNARAITGASALDLCTTPEAVELLLDSGADPCGSSKTGMTALHQRRSVPLRVFEVLLARGAAAVINARDQGGNTPVLYAAGHNPDAVLLFVNHGANLCVADLAGITVLHVAAMHRHHELADTFLDIGGNKDIQCFNGATPLHAAVRCMDEQMVGLFCKYKANANMQDYDGDTPLHYAAMDGNGPVAKLLVAHGADKTMRNKKGKTAEEAAKANGHHDVERVIRKAKKNVASQ